MSDTYWIAVFYATLREAGFKHPCFINPAGAKEIQVWCSLQAAVNDECYYA